MSPKILILSLFVPTLFLTGCFNTKPVDDPTRNYALSPLLKSQCVRNENQKVVGLARILIPEYLDRPKIVIEIAPNEYKLAEFHRWAESVERGVSRVITQNLSSQLPNFAIIPAPWKNLGKADYELHIHILDFKPQLFLCQTILRARYAVIDLENKKTIHSHEACITVPFGEECEEYLRVVSSMDEALAQFSQEIANKLNY